MTSHNFIKSQKTETSHTAFHDLVYHNYIESLLKKQPGAQIHMTIDRAVCDFDTPEGRKYQENDSDTQLRIAYKGPEGAKSGVRTVSEKTRQRYYQDVLLEVISVLYYDPQKPDMPMIDKMGWALLPSVAPYSPQMFSTVFHEKGKNQFTSILIAKYPQLKNYLTQELKIDELVASNKFKLLIKKMIQASPKSSSKVPCHKSFCDKAQYVVVAYNENKNRGRPYYTVSLTFSIDFLKSLKDINLHVNKLPVPILQNIAQKPKNK